MLVSSFSICSVYADDGLGDLDAGATIKNGISAGVGGAVVGGVTGAVAGGLTGAIGGMVTTTVSQLLK